MYLYYQYLRAWAGEPHVKNEEGQGMAEYALILALVAVLLIAAFLALKDQIATVLNQVTAGLTQSGE
ncbi:MAG: Flp family type IVb pilin [Anaerolineae bacterium]